jgi:hypothetical protein
MEKTAVQYARALASLPHIEEVCSLSQKANFKLNIAKCEVARTEILFLGHLIQQGTIKPDPENIRGLAENREPTSAEEVFRFVKVAEYHRKFIPKFSLIVSRKSEVLLV